MARNENVSLVGRGIAFLILQGALVPVALAAPASYNTVLPCRVFDSRRPADGPALSPGVARTINVAGVCGVPASATSVTMNVAVTQPTATGFVRVFASGPPPSPYFTVNYSAGQTRGNNAIVQLSPGGQVDALASMPTLATVHVILDVFGYFVDDASPTAQDDSDTVTEDALATTIDVLANDTDPDGGPISVSSVTQPANGTVVITNGGADLTYQPSPNYCNAPPATAPDSFTYTVWPGASIATVSVTVDCVNDAPVLGGVGTVAFTEGGPPVLVAPALTVADVDDVNLESAIVMISNLLDSGLEFLATNTTGTSVTANYVAPNLLLTGTDSVANYELVLRRVTYQNTAANPDIIPRFVAFVANDGSLDSSEALATVLVTPANDAPVLTAGGGAPTFTEDGGPVAVDPGLSVTDVDDVNLESATVTIANLLDVGAEALAAGTAGTSIVASYTAPTLTLIGSDTLARYQQVLRSVTYANTSQNPNATPRSIAFTANDGTANSNTVTKALTVTPANDAPVLTAGGGSPTFTEDGPAVAVDPGLTVSDVDDPNLESATVTITNLLDGGAEALAANTTGTSIVASYAAPTLTLIGTDTLAHYQQVLRSVTYLNSSQNPSTTARTIAFVANDGTANSNTATTSVGVTAVNDAPVLTAGGGSPTFTESGPPVTVDPALVVTDVDDVNLESATVTIANLLDVGAEALAAGTAGTSIVASYTAPTLTLTGSDTLARYQQVLRSVTYANTSQNPNATPRSIAFTANDGTANSNTVTKALTVTPANDAPVLTAGGGSPTFTEDGGAVAVDPGLTVSDVDDPNLESATVTITNLLDGGAEALAANTTGTSIVASYAAPTLTLIGTDTLAHYQQVLRSVTYLNSSQNPSTTARTIAFVANDGTANSNTATTSVGVTAVNDAPVLTAGGGSPTFTESGPPVTVDPALLVTDVDDVNLESATVTIANLLDAGLEILAANTGVTSIAATYTAPTLTLTGTDTRANYQAVLRSVTYFSSSQSPNTTARTLQFVANDGTVNSNTVATTLSVISLNDGPVLTAGGGSPTFTEDGAAVVVDNGLTITDVNDTNLESATVTITNLLNAGAEALAANTAGTSILASYVAPTVTLTGSDTLANYQAVLRSVTYANTSQNPNTTPRSLAFRANDGTDLSNIVTTLVTVVAVNDAPAVAGTGTVTFTEDAGAVGVASGLLATDVDNTSLASATVTITNVVDAGFEVLTVNTGATAIVANYVAPTLTLTGADTLANYQAVLRTVAYNNASNTPNPTPRSLAFTVNDGSVNSNIALATVQVVPVNDPPILTTNPITYLTVGNTQLHVAGDTLPGVASIADPQGALTKSSPTDADGPVAPSVVAASGPSANGGRFTIDTDGSFTYVPPVGFPPVGSTGTDSFTYQVTDALASVIGTVNVTVSSVVWYVRDVIDANNPAGGDGRSTNAFETLAAAQAASGNNHYVFVFEGNTATTPLAGGIVLKDGQKLYGEGVGLNVGGFGDIVPAGNPPRINNAGGDAVSVPATTGNRNGVEIRGLDLQGSANAIDVTASGANAVNVTITSNTIRLAGEEGIDLNAGSTGLFAAIVQSNTIVAIGNGFDARTSAPGQLRVDFSTNTVFSLSNAVVIDGSGGGSTIITGFASNVVNANTAGDGIVVNVATFDATPGVLPFDPVSGGQTAIGVPGNGTGGRGMVLTSISGNLAFTDLDVFADGGVGLRVIGTGAFTGSAGTQVSVGAGVATIAAVAGPGADLASMTANLPLASLSSLSSVTTGVSLVSVAGTLSASSGAITNAAGTDFAIDGGTGNITYGGTITDDVGPLVTVANKTGGSSVSFTGAISDFDDGDGGGVSLTNNGGGGGATITFSGGLVLNTGDNPAFTATGGGTINVCDENPCAPATGGLVNTLTTTTATALSVTNATIGTNGLAFRSVSANGATSGIVLNNTGAGGLTVTGDGGGAANGSGGTIQGATGPGISLTTTGPVRLTQMNVQNGADHGILGTSVAGFALNRCTIANNGNAAGEDGIDLTGLTGNVSITNSTISGSRARNVFLHNTSGTVTSLLLQGNTIGDNSATADGQEGVFLQVPTGSASFASVLVTGNTFTNNRTTGLRVSAEGTGSVGMIEVTGNTFTGNPIGVDLATNGNANIDFNVHDNPTMVGDRTQVNIANNGSAGSVMRGHIRNNPNIALNPAAGGKGISVVADGGGTIVVNVENNAVAGFGDRGIHVEARGGPAQVDARISSNTVSTTAVSSLAGLLLHIGNGGGASRLCANVGGNNMSGGPGAVADYQVHRFTSPSATFQLQGLSPSPATAAQAAAFLISTDVAPPATAFVENGDYTNGVCAVPPF